MIGGRFEILLAVEDCDRVRGEKQAICGGEVVLDVYTHGGKRGRRRGESCGLVWGSYRGVPGFAAFCFSPSGPLDMSVFHRMVVTRPPSPMTHLTKTLVFQRHYAPLLLIANLVGVGTVVIPMLPKGSAIFACVSFGFPGELLKAGWYRVASVFLVKHRGHMVGTTRVSGGVVDGHGSGHGHIGWFGDGDGYW